MEVKEKNLFAQDKYYNIILNLNEKEIEISVIESYMSNQDYTSIFWELLNMSVDELTQDEYNEIDEWVKEKKGGMK